MTDRLPTVYRVDLTDTDRKALSSLILTAVELTQAIVQGESISNDILPHISWIDTHSIEIANLVVRLNKDIISRDDAMSELAQKFDGTANELMRRQLDEIREMIAAADAMAGPMVVKLSPFRSKMMWLIEELEKRI